MGKLLLVMLVFLITPICLAQTTEMDSYDLKILYNKVLVVNEIVFDETHDTNFFINIPKDASALSLYINDELQEPAIKDNKIRLTYFSVKKIKLSYITKEPLEKDSILINLISPFETKLFNVTLTLPEESVLEKPLENGMGGSIYPKPDKATTDGRSLIFEWQRQDMEKDQELAIFVKYKSKPRLGLLFWSLALIIIGLVMYTFSRKPKVERIIEKEEAMEIHLKEDEEQIVTILKNREGKCEQGTLRVITGFSKATLSRLLKELEDRKIVYKEKRGKKNLVFLKK